MSSEGEATGAENRTVLTEFREDGIAVITINRPTKLNALNAQVMADFGHALDELDEMEAREGVRGLIVTGAGEKAFVAGADIAELSVLDRASGERLSRQGQALFKRVEDMTVPSVAVVNGFALGGGAELAMACHMRIAGPKAVLGLPEVSLGLIPGYGGTQRLARLVGMARAIEYITTGGFIDAETAERIGLVNRVADDPMDEALKLLGKVLKQAPLAVRAAIRAVQQTEKVAGAAVASGGPVVPGGSVASDGPVAPGGAVASDGYAVEAALFGELCESHDVKEGTSAFLEKRKPDFKGR